MQPEPFSSIGVLFTPDAFTVDFPPEAENARITAWKAQYASDRFRFLFHLGFEAPPDSVSPALRYLFQLSARFVRELTAQPALEITREQTTVPLNEDALSDLLNAVPFGLGTEYITPSWLTGVFSCLEKVFSQEIAEYPGTVSLYLAEKTENLRLPERVFFHLVENRRDEAFPFAFLATYTTRDAQERVRHMPLNYALTEFKGSRDKLVSMLSCLNDAAECSAPVSRWMTSGELFHALRLTSEEAWEFLKSVPDLEKAGIACRLPNWWRRKASAVSLTVKLGEKQASLLGLDSLISMVPSLTVDGVRLTKADIRLLLSQADGLALIKGKWVEVNHERLTRLLEEMERFEGEFTLMDALRMQSGLSASRELPSGVEITNGKWLASVLSSLTRPKKSDRQPVPASVHAVLRPYQMSGYAWLSQMSTLGLGACLADDMGLGKTLQVLTLIASVLEHHKRARVLLVVPASLLGNWEKEIERFTPSLRVCRLHGASGPKLELQLTTSDASVFLTTYGMAVRLDGLKAVEWDYLILDEAQAIKNPGTRQAKAVKAIPALHRIAMTGTPIENDLTNLWSLFDFLNTGLLGTSREFDAFAKELSARPEGYARLKQMVSPFILRRLKTDKSIISDLPDKIDQTDYLSLSKKQVVLYHKAVDDLARSLPAAEGIQRRGMVLAALTQLKQICNHPDQYLGQTAFVPEESGKFDYLAEICSTIRDRHERVLVFTQYREMALPLHRFLKDVFGREGLLLHGGTSVRERTAMVERFNGDEYIPYMVLTIKAGGTGLNLTAANHVVLFDRWWNPAVENQAMDRAFRIGQTRNVFVHRFVAQGTIEEKIDTLLRSKQQLADRIVGEGSEQWITEMSDQELLNMMKLEV